MTCRQNPGPGYHHHHHLTKNKMTIVIRKTFQVIKCKIEDDFKFSIDRKLTLMLEENRRIREVIKNEISNIRGDWTRRRNSSFIDEQLKWITEVEA
jgi:hypothetical protein